MKKLILIALLLSIINEIKAQSFTQNLDKYWYYRYRLVNDFMKIGDGPGESLPAPKRKIGSTSNETGRLSWESDPTIDLGNYISMLATEYKLLSHAGLSTHRTEYELEKALNAFIRLDDNAEDYCDDIDNSYPPAINYWSYNDRHNGFFIRDDVPYFNFITDNYNHFNRPGLAVDINQIASSVEMDPDPSQAGKKGGSSMWGRYAGIIPGTNQHAAIDDEFGGTNTPRYPLEESQDQLASIWPGLALTSKFVNNNTLKTKADDMLFKTLEWISKGQHQVEYDVPIGGQVFPIGTTLKWIITNPLTNKPVYGNRPQDYISKLDAGGQLFTISSSPACVALNILTGKNLDAKYDLIFQAAQFRSSKNTKDMMFLDIYAAFARNWKVAGIQSTWKTIRNHAVAANFNSPHIPLIYKWMYPKNAIDYDPWDFRNKNGVQKCPGYEISRYEELLNKAPTCGIYNMSGQYHDYEWSGNDRLWEPYHRYSATSDKRCGENLGFNHHFNGLDYMLLFNLYCWVKGDYMQYHYNPYYWENYSKSYPHWVRADLMGSKDAKLKLNFLQYASFISKIYDKGYVTLRCGQVIDLLPGFEASYGSNVNIIIKDYECAGDRYNNLPFNHAQVARSQTGVMPGLEFYEPYYDSIGVPFFPPVHDTIYNEDTLADLITPEQDSMYFDSLSNLILNSEDTGMIYMYYKMFGDDSTGEGNMNKSIKGKFGNTFGEYLIAKKDRVSEEKSAKVNVLKQIQIYPNPNTGSFTVLLPAIGDYDIIVKDIVGVEVYRDKLKNERTKEVQLDAKLPPGNYVVYITGKDLQHTQRISVVR